MKPINTGGHAAYQKHVLDSIREYYTDLSSIPSQTLQVIEKFYNLDLSKVDQQLYDRYSVFGPKPRLPSDMLRSMLVALEFNIISYTEWSAQLKINPLFAIVSGFSPGNTPGVGTFYDFISRLWISDSPNFNSSIHVPKTKVKKPLKNGDKADSIEKDSVESLLNKFQLNPPSTDQPFSKLFEIFKSNFLNVSVDKGLLDMSSLAISGDGSPVVTAARERSKSICKCRKQGIKCSCPRKYSQPDCDIGWDSLRLCYYSGYDLYLLTASDSLSDLPIFPLLNPASRHDSLGFLHNWFLMRQFIPEANVSKVILDSAHDAGPMYDYFDENHITPFIDINPKRSSQTTYKNFTIGDDGVPICSQGLKMKHDGSEKAKHRIKFKCPLFNRNTMTCSCSQPCSSAKYGRTVHVFSPDNLRLFNDPPRDSKAWRNEYKRRTSSERDNKRVKLDFKLEDGRHRSSKNWYCRLYCILMCIHMDAWYSA